MYNILVKLTYWFTYRRSGRSKKANEEPMEEAQGMGNVKATKGRKNGKNGNAKQRK
jgi:hypothetical protein